MAALALHPQTRAMATTLQQHKARGPPRASCRWTAGVETSASSQTGALLTRGRQGPNCVHSDFGLRTWFPPASSRMETANNPKSRLTIESRLRLREATRSLAGVSVVKTKSEPRISRTAQRLRNVSNREMLGASIFLRDLHLSMTIFFCKPFADCQNNARDFLQLWHRNDITIIRHQ